MNPNLKIEKRILNISFIGSIAFLIAEVVMALITGSNAVFMDCVFDVADIVMIGPFMLLIPLLYKNETEKRPYGFSQVESLFVLIKSGVLIVITSFLGIDSIKTIINGGNEVDATSVAIFELIVSFVCVIMYICLSRLNKKYTSPAVKTEVYIWKLDSLSTLGVGVAFIIKHILDSNGFSNIGLYVDPIIAIIIAIFLLREPISLFIEAVKNLILFAPDEETTGKIRKICSEGLEKYGCYISFLDVVKTGRKLWIVAYFVLDRDTVSVKKLREANKIIKEGLSKEFDSINIELVPDIDELEFEKIKAKNIARRPDKTNYMEKQTEIKRNKKETKQEVKEIKKVIKKEHKDNKLLLKSKK